MVTEYSAAEHIGGSACVLADLLCHSAWCRSRGCGWERDNADLVTW